MSLRWSLLLVPLYLLFVNLDHVALWDDEAQTATFARNYNQTHQLTGWNGHNLYAYRNGTLLRADLSTIQPPLDIIVTALSFRWWGESRRTARVLFAVAGLVSWVLLFAWTKTWSAGGSVFVYWATLAYGCSVAFIINARQCRYYGLCLMFGTALLWLVGIGSAHKRRWPWAVFPVAFLGLYLSNYLVGVAWLLALVLVGGVFHRERVGQNRVWVSMSVLTSLIMAVSHAVYFRIWDRADIIYSDSWLHRRLHHLWNYPRDIIYFLPLTLAVVVWALAHRHGQAKVKWVLALLVANAAFLALLTPQPGDSPYSDIRFMVLAIPLSAYAMGYLLVCLERRARWLAWLVFGIATTTNVFALGYTRQHFQWTLPQLGVSLHREYPTSIAMSADYLKLHAQSGDTFLAAPDHFNYPLAYLLPQLVNCCTLDQHTPLKSARKLTAPLFKEENEPRWLILFERLDHTLAVLREFSDRGLHYELVKSLNVYWDQTQRPEPMFHRFLPVVDFDRARSGVYIYRKR